MSKTEALRQHLMSLYNEHLAAGMIPTSGRFLFYELEQRGIVSKKATGARRADQNTIDALKRLRDRGEIPWEAIVDETRSLDDFTGFGSIAEGVDTFLNAIRLDPWNGDPPLTLTESRSLAGVLRALTRDYAAKISSTNGQVGGFLHTAIAPHLRDGTRVLYLGDYDLAGGDIEANTRRVLERYADLQWERLALTAGQVREHKLTPIIKTDRRFKDGRPHEAVETEALSQSLIVKIVRDRLDSLLPQPLAAIRTREEREREILRALIAP